jgi:hypothetical protein
MKNKSNVLEKINKVIYNGSYLSNEDLESFFNRRKRGMTFILDNEYISKIKQRNYGKLEIYYKNKEIKTVTAKIITLEYSNDNYYIGIEVDNAEKITSLYFNNREMIEASLFLKKLYSNYVIFPDLHVLIDNNENYVKIPFYNEDEELVCYKIMSRKKALGIKRKQPLLNKS